MKDYYNILGVDASASDDQIRQAYKRLAMQHHPDRGGDQARFQEIQEAYSTLTDNDKRAQWEQQRSFGQGHHPGGFGFSFNFGQDINDIIRTFHGGHFGQGFQQRPRNRDLRVTIDLDLASTLQPQVQYVEINDNHNGKRTVQVNVPRGVQSGMQMRFPGHGETHVPNAPPGDLYVDFRIRPAAGFAIDGLNLCKKVTVNAVDAIVGTRINVDGLDGKSFELIIPSGTQPSTQFRLGHQGLWDINHPRRGDLMIEIVIEIPRSVSQQQLDQLSNLKETT